MQAVSQIAQTSEELASIRRMCEQHNVARLELFGSAVGEKFDPARSDLDFLVDFQPLAPSDRADAYFGLLADLQDYFQREVDLVETGAVTNPYFQRSIDATRRVLYAA